MKARVTFHDLAVYNSMNSQHDGHVGNRSRTKYMKSRSVWVPQVGDLVRVNGLKHATYANSKLATIKELDAQGGFTVDLGFVPQDGCRLVSVLPKHVTLI